MKSVQIKRYGGSDVVELNDTASVPSVSVGKILVDVKASGVNPADWKVREGYFQQIAPLQFPSNLGFDFSGTVKQLGEGVPSDFKQGDEVYGQTPVLSGGSGIIISTLEQPNSELMQQYGVKATFQFTQVNRQRLTKLAQWVDQNNIKINVDRTFSLDEAGKALDYQKDVHPRGKVVITI